MKITKTNAKTIMQTTLAIAAAVCISLGSTSMFAFL